MTKIITLLCVDCHKSADPPFRNGTFEPARCESCAVQKYKTQNPYWKVAVLKNPILKITVS